MTINWKLGDRFKFGENGPEGEVEEFFNRNTRVQIRFDKQSANVFDIQFFNEYAIKIAKPIPHPVIDWQPIETLPTDETRVFVLSQENEMAVGSFKPSYVNKCYTHWSPLPELPKVG